MQQFHQSDRVVGRQRRLFFDRSILVVFEIVDQRRGLEFQFESPVASMPFKLEPASRHRHDLRYSNRIVGQKVDEPRNALDHLGIDRARSVTISAMREQC